MFLNVSFVDGMLVNDAIGKHFVAPGVLGLYTTQRMDHTTDSSRLIFDLGSDPGCPLNNRKSEYMTRVRVLTEINCPDLHDRKLRRPGPEVTSTRRILPFCTSACSLYNRRGIPHSNGSHR